MYCRECGSQIQEGSRYCSSCGAEQAGNFKQKKNNAGGFLAGVAVCALLVLVGFFVLGKDQKEEVPKPTEQVSVEAHTEPVQTEPKVVETEAPTTEPIPQPPADGWHEENAKRYYYSGGERLTGLQEIDNDLYYFDSDGVLAVNTKVEINDNSVEAGRDGRITAVTFAWIDGEWSSEKYHFGNNGKSSIKELEREVTNCDHADIYIEANGLHGAKVNGNWKVYVRSHGSWVFAKEVSFAEPKGAFTIRFDSPMDFDAITAYPTVQGNASYSSYFALANVHMFL